MGRFTKLAVHVLGQSPHTLPLNLLVDIYKRLCGSRVPEKTLAVLGASLVLSERCNGSADHLEVEFRQTQNLSKLIENTLAIIAGVEKASVGIGEDKRLRGRIRRTRFQSSSKAKSSLGLSASVISNSSNTRSIASTWLPGPASQSRCGPN